jgi:tetratricopeptide (TPR) repeat protein
VDGHLPNRGIAREDGLVARDDWYRCTSWTDGHRERFEQRLARARPENRAQYLRIQGVYLGGSGDPDVRDGAIELFARVISQYPDALSEVAGAHIELARYYEAAGDIEAAVDHYRATLAAESAGNVHHGVELDFAELIVEQGLEELYEVADTLLDVAANGAPYLFEGARSRYLAVRERLATNRGLDPRDVAIMPPGGWPEPTGHDEAAVIQALRDAGHRVDDLERWSMARSETAADAREIAELLIPWFERTDDLALKADIVRRLADHRVRKIAARPFLAAFRDLHSPELAAEGPPSSDLVRTQRRLKHALGDALWRLARDEHFDELAEILRDARHGQDRWALLLGFQHLKHPEAFDVAVELVDDPGLHFNALHALADLRSERAEPILRALAAQPRPEGRDAASEHVRAEIAIAQHGLAKLAKARAAGKSRP